MGWTCVVLNPCECSPFIVWLGGVCDGGRDILTEGCGVVWSQCLLTPKTTTTASVPTTLATSTTTA